jgi:hypothetical protein
MKGLENVEVLHSSISYLVALGLSSSDFDIVSVLFCFFKDSPYPNYALFAGGGYPYLMFANSFSQ